ncbi:MAG: hypothetical protein J5545_08895 [Bacteroidaceae bacterium]|nr:hypothetical protein [Bacteroidaceae bacterium]
MKRVLFCCLLACWTAAAALQARHHVSVTKFGAIPDDGYNDADALRRAAAYCRTHKGTTLLFPAGTYDLVDSTAVDIERRAINGAFGKGLEVQWQLFRPDRPFVTGLDFTGAQGLRIKADGATLRVGGWMQVLSFIRCKDVSLSGLNITNRRPAATEGLITAATDSTFDITFDPELYCYIDSIVQGRYYFYSTTRQHFYYGNVGNGELLRPGHIRFRSRSHPAVGDVLIIRYCGHYRPCVLIRESQDITLKDVALRSFSGMGIVGHMSQNICIDGLCVKPEPGRYSSTSTDATHFTSCSGDLILRNSFFSGNGDDCTNIHNYYWAFYPQAADNQVEIRVENADLHAQSLDVPAVGDTLRVVSRQDMSTVAEAVVTAADSSWTDWRVIVTLDRPLAVTQPENYLMYNYTRFPRVRIQNNKVEYHNGRAFLLKARDVEVTANDITRCTLSAIKLGAELSWREAGPVERVLVADNIISHTGTDSGYRASCVMLTTEAPQTPPQVNRGIVIRHNRLQSDQPVSILLQDATNVQITDNEFIGGHEIQQHNCTNVTINNNQIKP